MSEFYGLEWIGKKNASHLAVSPCAESLVFVPQKSLLPNLNDHLLIAADNLSALKLLRPDFENCIRLIYIDPPYNTGENHLYGYSDKFTQNKNKPEQSQESLSQSAWLSMIYPRLFAARHLLAENGLMAVSIDNREVFQLKLLMDEVFGSQNFVGELIWVNRTTPNDTKLNFATTHEYILFYAKNKKNIRFKGLKKDTKLYKNPDQDPRGAWIADNPSAASGALSYRYPILNPLTQEEIFPPKGRYWAFAPQRVAEWSASGKIKFYDKKGRGFLLKKYLSELRSDFKPLSSILSGILTAQGTRELKSLYEEGAPFKYPKPTALMRLLIDQLTDETDWVMDFFAGSGSTAQAVLDTNHQQASQRKFICVQSQEPYAAQNKAYQADFETVADLTRDRIQRVCARINQLQNTESVGFKYFETL